MKGGRDPPKDIIERESNVSCSVVSDSFPHHHGLQLTRPLYPWGFSRQEYWSGLPFLSPGDLPDPGIEPVSPALQADSLLSESPREAPKVLITLNNS